jgi:uncharacterized protein (DUF1330 family)
MDEIFKNTNCNFTIREGEEDDMCRNEVTFNIINFKECNTLLRLTAEHKYTAILDFTTKE